MKTASANSDGLYFLDGGGEMGALIRSLDWSQTSLGTPDQWSQSLRTTLGTLLHSAFPMVLYWGEDLRCFYNDAFRPGLSTHGKQPIIGKKASEVWDEIRGFSRSLIEHVMTTAKPVWFKDHLVPFYRNGRMEELYWTFSHSPVYDDNGQVNGVLVTCIETTEQVHFRRKAEKSEQRFRALVESAPFPIGVYIGKEMRIELANQAIIEAWNKGNEVIGRLYSDVLPELENQKIFSQLEEVYTTGVPFHARNQRVDLLVNGKLQPYYFNYSLTPLFDLNGNIYGVMNTAAEVTDLNLAKQKIEQSEQNLRNMILQAPVAMCILLGPLHKIEVANELMIELWGKPVAYVMGKPVFEALPDAREQGLEQLLDDVFRTGKTFKADERPVILLRKGILETVYQNFVYEPYIDADGTVKGVLVVSIDVTEQVLARQKIEEVVTERTKELALANNNLQKSNAELAQFAYIASHDLQEPLRKISTFTQMLQSRISDGLDEQSKNYINKINNASSRMNTLIRDVLTYSELVKETEVFSEVNLNQVLENALTDFELLIEQKGATIQCTSLPTIEAIPLQMSQLFGNLIGNSLKFTGKDTKPIITISSHILSEEEKDHLSLETTLEYCKIQFRDNGIGFKAEYADQIFHIFQRLHRKSDYEGTGIGLAMCKKIVLNHHGDLNAEGSSEKGAVFNVLLPMKQF